MCVAEKSPAGVWPRWSKFKRRRGIPKVVLRPLFFALSRLWKTSGTQTWKIRNARDGLWNLRMDGWMDPAMCTIKTVQNYCEGQWNRSSLHFEAMIRSSCDTPWLSPENLSPFAFRNISAKNSKAPPADLLRSFILHVFQMIKKVPLPTSPTFHFSLPIRAVLMGRKKSKS